MLKKRPDFLNFQVDHMTLLLDPKLYNVSYALLRIVFGVDSKEILYEKRKEWEKGKGEVSMTFAARIGRGNIGGEELQNTIMALVQPSEPTSQPSHVRQMLQDHQAAAHWQHIALRVPDLIAFHEYALERGVNFITPILKEDDEDLIQVFSGEWFFPGSKPSGMFFEFVQRNPTEALLKKLESRNRESWFRDKTFMGLYAEKEAEYQKGRATPFIDEALFEKIYIRLKSKQVWQITDEDLASIEEEMITYALNKRKAGVN